ncbi:MAG: hypothetical protein AAGI44_01530 [Pseudomonadota bacterium]
MSAMQIQTVNTAPSQPHQWIKTLGRALILMFFPGAGLAIAQNLDGLGDQFANRSAENERAMRTAISEIESQHGAYGEQLTEQMLSLGLVLQQQGRHSEALSTFKRGVHLARINQGLYTPEQIPLLEGEIKSAIALGDYDLVYELQEYLYRVQDRSMPAGVARAKVLLQQADWHFEAYQLQVGPTGPERLLNMWDLYRGAWEDIRNIEGNTSLNLLTPLYGLLRTQYLISQYHASNDGSSSSGHAGYKHPSVNRFYAHRAQNFELGSSVIQTIYNIQRENHGASSEQAANALVSLGDWQMWYEKRDKATETYRFALAELAQQDADQQKVEDLLEKPVPLPDMNGLSALPAPVSTDRGDILLEFGINSRGRVVDLTRLDDNDEMDSSAIRLMRNLRATKFRPRFENGEPVETDKLVRAYEITASK